MLTYDESEVEGQPTMGVNGESIIYMANIYIYIYVYTYIYLRSDIRTAGNGYWRVASQGEPHGFKDMLTHNARAVAHNA